jgi:hypothetical protein
MVEAGFEYVTEVDGVKLFWKVKNGKLFLAVTN